MPVTPFSVFNRGPGASSKPANATAAHGAAAARALASAHSARMNAPSPTYGCSGGTRNASIGKAKLTGSSQIGVSNASVAMSTTAGHSTGAASTVASAAGSSSDAAADL